MNYDNRFFDRTPCLFRPSSLAVALLVAAQLLSFAAYADQVIDEETGKPLEGVFVMVNWWSDGPGIANASTVCYAFETLKTDKDGTFDMPRFSWNFNPLYWERRCGVALYLAGYERSPNDNHIGDIAIMRRFKGTAEDRLKYLVKVGNYSSCMSQRESKKKLLPVHQARLVEAESIAVTSAEKELAWIVGDSKNYIELDDAEYWKWRLEKEKK